MLLRNNLGSKDYIHECSATPLNNEFILKIKNSTSLFANIFAKRIKMGGGGNHFDVNIQREGPFN